MADVHLNDRATPNLPSRHFDATEALYAGFGFTRVFRDDGWMILTRGGLQLEFFPAPGVDPWSSSFMCCLRVADVDELRRDPTVGNRRKDDRDATPPPRTDAGLGSSSRLPRRPRWHPAHADRAAVMAFVAFFRNVNLGQPGSPTSRQILDAFGGPAVARNFQTNGTVVFRTDDSEAAGRGARRELSEAGIERGFVVRSLTEVNAIAGELPPADPHDESARVVVSFFDLPPGSRTPTAPPHGSEELLDVRTLDASYAVSVSRRRGTSVGDATSFLERMLGVPVTTRNGGTVQRLVVRENRR